MMNQNESLTDEFDRFFDVTNPRAIEPVSGPVSLPLIGAAEETLGLKFPPSYRFFLQKYGAAQFSTYEIFGLFELKNAQLPEFFDVVSVTINLREEELGENSLPIDSIAIATDTDGIIFCLDTSDLSENEPSIVARAGRFRPTKVANNFLDFLRIITTLEFPFQHLG